MRVRVRGNSDSKKTKQKKIDIKKIKNKKHLKNKLPTEGKGYG